MKYLLVTTLFLIVGCASQKPDGAEFPLYSEQHLDFVRWKRNSDCCTAKGTKAAVASGGTNASQAGIDMLKAGGNAVDAAVATAFVLAVERPHSAGLGGGGFMTLHLERIGDFFVDFREEAPGKATRDMYLDKKGEVIPNLSLLGAKSVAVPGFVSGLYEIHKKWGKLPWKALLEPAVRVAERGFPVYPTLAEYLNDDKECLSKERETKSLFFNADGSTLAVGANLVQKDLGNTLRLIAKDGDKPFRTGVVAERFLKYTKARGGILTAADFKKYKVKFREPVKFTFKDYAFLSAPPPSAGGVLIGEILNVLEPYSFDDLLKKPENYVHAVAESMKFAYADRSVFVGDPDFSKMDYAKLLTKEYAAQIRSKILADKATPSSEIRPGGGTLKEGKDTTHLSVIDSEGNAVASTITINGHFGSCLAPDGTGVFLNNEMDDFSAKPGAQNLYGLTGNDANAIAPGKRPASSMSPTIVFKSGTPILAVGAAGGSRITTSVLQVILNDLLVYPGDLKRALFAPRFHHQWIPDKLNVEKGISDEIIAKLREKGHEVSPPPFSPIVHAVSRDAAGMTAVFDPRDEGGAAAY